MIWGSPCSTGSWCKNTLFSLPLKTLLLGKLPIACMCILVFPMRSNLTEASPLCARTKGHVPKNCTPCTIRNPTGDHPRNLTLTHLQCDLMGRGFLEEPIPDAKIDINGNRIKENVLSSNHVNTYAHKIRGLVYSA